MKVKKFITVLLVLMLLTTEVSIINFSAFGSTSVAAEIEIATEATQYFGNQLPKDVRKFYDVMMRMYETKDANGKTLFEKGESSADLVAEGIVSKDEVIAYTTGSQQLLNNVMAARDAFQYDVPGAFYIDFSALSLRVTSSVVGNETVYHAYIGAGRRDNYFLPGFNADNVASAVSDYNELLAAAVKAVKENAGENADDEAKTRAAHDWVAKNMDYKFEYQVKNFPTEEKNTDGSTPYSNARTAYDCFKYGEGVCEAYTRGFKAIMDELGIPCVCVYGMFQQDETTGGEHIWNYVKIGGEWYGVDVTNDDPAGYNRLDSGKENQQYCLVGELILNEHHIPVGTLSASGYEFSYPELPNGVYSLSSKLSEDGGFRIIEDEETQTVKVSYNKKNSTQNMEEGTYILVRFKYSDGQWYGWYYCIAEYYDYLEVKPKTDEWYDEDPYLGNYLCYEIPHLRAIQFAVTEIPPAGTLEGYGDIIDQEYYGGEEFVKDTTPEFENKGEVYVAPPYIQSATPIQSYKLGFGKTYNMTVTFTDALESDGTESKTDYNKVYEIGNNVKENLYVKVFSPDENTVGDTTGQLALTGYGLNSNYTVRQKTTSIKNSNIKITNIDLGKREINSDGTVGKLERPASISFTFTPDDTYAGAETIYIIDWIGVQGVKSKKAPNHAVWTVGGGAAYVCAIAMAAGQPAVVYGQPELMDTDFSGMSITGSSGSDIAGGIDLSKITNRITLVSTSTSAEQEENMKNQLTKGNEVDANAKIDTYNIALMVCRESGKWINNKYVKVCMGFPEGMTYEMFLEGEKTFKAYHYQHDENGKLTGEYEEIEIEVVRQGLILYIKEFSPFAIVTLNGDGQKVSEQKVVLSSTDGGKITTVGTVNKKTDSANKSTESDSIDMSVNETVEIKVTADEGKVIDSIAVGGITIPIPKVEGTGINATEMKFIVVGKGEEEEVKEPIIIDKDETITVKLSEVGTTRIIASFVSDEVVKAEAKKGQDSVAAAIPMIEELRSGSINLMVNNVKNKIDLNVLNTSIKSLKEKLVTNYTVKVFNRDGEDITEKETEKIGTGSTIEIVYSTNNKAEYTTVVYGDITGSGNILTSDLNLVKQHYTATMTGSEDGILENEYLEAADIDGSGQIRTSDLNTMKKLYLEELAKKAKEVN